MPLSGNQIDRESIEDAARRAAAAPLTFNPGERSKYVKSMVSLVINLKNQGVPVDEIKSKVPEFAEQYQNLFEMITGPNGFDKRNLEIMLSMLDHMQKGNLTQHDASVIVGKRLFEKYGQTRHDTS